MTLKSVITPLGMEVDLRQVGHVKEGEDEGVGDGVEVGLSGDDDDDDEEERMDCKHSVD